MDKDNVYQQKVCITCMCNKNCKKDKFKKYTYGDRVSYRCLDYKFNYDASKNR